MLPNQGQGAAMCIEDAGALGVLFRQMPSASAAAVSSRLALFEQLRRPRASVVQLISHQPYFEDGVERMRKYLIEIMPLEQLPRDREALRPWLFSYDVINVAKEVLGRFLENASSIE